MRFSKNPLPGMNPWLEASWGDIHTSLTTYARDAIQRQLPDDLQARVEEYLSVYEPDQEPLQRRRVAPDVQIIEQPNRLSRSAGSTAPLLLDEQPLRIRRRSEPQTLHYLQIVDIKAQRRVITAIEFISLANKTTSAGRRQYLAKQNQFLAAEVNLVEIDLLRDGSWVLSAEEAMYPGRLKHPYRICVVRADAPEEAEVYQADFRTPLPSIRIPLRSHDADVFLPLQSLVDLAYENGRYGNDIDYTCMPEPPLHADEFEWIRQRLSAL